MFPSFRLAMTWIHTWFGLVFGFVLFSVFFFGSLSVFDREIDRWAIPETRFEPQSMPSFDAILTPAFERIEPDPEELAAARARTGAPLSAPLTPIAWSAYTTHRDPVLSLYAEFAVPNPRDPDDHVHGHATMDPRSGRHIPSDRLQIGSAFFYPLHYSLHLHWLGLGYWLVGAAALLMLVLLLSGVVIHKKLFREFFTFRPQKLGQRRILDLHNLAGVVALPFHAMFALTGLIIFAGIYFPLSETTMKPLAQKHEVLEAQAKGLPHTRTGEAGSLASVDAMIVEAKRRWAARAMPGEVGYLAVTHRGDRNAYVSVYRAGSDRVTLVGQAVHFEGSTGRVLYEEPPPTPIASVQEFLTGLHLQHFEHWLLRWLYVFGGFSGAVCIATGLIFFVGKRKEKHAAQGISAARWIDALTVASVLGPIVATLSLLVANRVLPDDLIQRATWEERVFWWSWVAALGHALLRSRAQGRGLAPAWRDQCLVIAGLALGAVLLNWMTTGDHIASTVSRGYWPVAGLDLALLGVSALALGAWLKLSERASPTERRPAGPAGVQEMMHG